LGWLATGYVKRYSAPSGVVVLWSHVGQPIELQDAALTENGKVVGPLLAGRYHEDLLVPIAE
jgi:hypothetical protein